MISGHALMLRNAHHSCLSAGCDRRVFMETRLCLAVLYSLLSQYKLREAQEFGDHMARLILHRAGHYKSTLTCESAFRLIYWTVYRCFLSLLMLIYSTTAHFQQTQGKSKSISHVSFAWLLLCSRLVSLPVGASGPSQWCGLCRGSEPWEIYGLLFCQSTSIHLPPSLRGLPASAASSSWCVFSIVCEIIWSPVFIFDNVLFQPRVLGAWCHCARRRSLEQGDNSSCRKCGQ